MGEDALAGKIPPETQLRFFFVEKDRARAESLQQLVAALKLPKNYRVKLEPGITFEKGFGRLLQLLDGKLPPTFAFIDPFGWAAPVEIVKTILAAPNCEVLVNFMYEEINRFLAHPDEGQSKMKDAMWKVDDSGEFRFSDATDPNHWSCSRRNPRPSGYGPSSRSTSPARTSRWPRSKNG
jgi:three-Cys-motif partner protein